MRLACEQVRWCLVFDVVLSGFVFFSCRAVAGSLLALVFFSFLFFSVTGASLASTDAARSSSSSSRSRSATTSASASASASSSSAQSGVRPASAPSATSSSARRVVDSLSSAQLVSSSSSSSSRPVSSSAAASVSSFAVSSAPVARRATSAPTIGLAAEPAGTQLMFGLAHRPRTAPATVRAVSLASHAESVWFVVRRMRFLFNVCPSLKTGFRPCARARSPTSRPLLQLALRRLRCRTERHNNTPWRVPMFLPAQRVGALCCCSTSARSRIERTERKHAARRALFFSRHCLTSSVVVVTRRLRAVSSPTTSQRRACCANSASSSLATFCGLHDTNSPILRWYVCAAAGISAHAFGFVSFFMVSCCVRALRCWTGL